MGVAEGRIVGAVDIVPATQQRYRRRDPCLQPLQQCQPRLGAPEPYGRATGILTRIEFSPIASDATRIAALLSGELDFITPAPLQDIDRINRSDGVSVIEGPELRTIMLGFNYGDTLHSSNLTDANPLQDLRVRQALNLAIDMDLIRKKVMRGKSRVAPVRGW